MVRKVTQAKFDEWAKDDSNIADVLERMAGGLTLQKTAVAIKQPYMCLYGWFKETPERWERYMAARQAWINKRKDELVDKVDAVKADRDHVARLKLESDIIDNQAKAYHRELWGERVQVDKTITVDVDSGLLGTASELLRLVKKKPVTIEGEVVPALVEAKTDDGSSH